MFNLIQPTMRISRATNQSIKYACTNFHYAKSVPANPIGYNIYNASNEWCGVILYAVGANYQIGSEYDLPIGRVLELVRVALNGKQECTSQALALSLKQLKKDRPLVELIVSYADCDQNHLGTIYQATNWIYVGENGGGSRCGFLVNGKKMHNKSVHSRKIVVNGKSIHCPQTLQAVRQYLDPNAIEIRTKGKRKYLMPLTKNMRKKITPLMKPYPKNDDWVKIDRESFKNQ